MKENLNILLCKIDSGADLGALSKTDLDDLDRVEKAVDATILRQARVYIAMDLRGYYIRRNGFDNELLFRGYSVEYDAVCKYLIPGRTTTNRIVECDELYLRQAASYREHLNEPAGVTFGELEVVEGYWPKTIASFSFKNDRVITSAKLAQKEFNGLGKPLMEYSLGCASSDVLMLTFEDGGVSTLKDGAWDLLETPNPT